MRNALFVAVLAALTVGASAQDKITLANGDVITGKIKTMKAGEVTIESPLLGEMVVPLANIGDLVTQDRVTLQTKTGDLWQRRIVGIEGGSLRLEGGETSALSLENLRMINPPEDPEPEWNGSVKFTGLYATGNTDRRAAGLLFDASRRTTIDRITVDASWDYSEDKDGDPTSSSFRQWRLNQRRAGGGLKYDYFLGERWYLLATARVLGDTLADLELRFTSGLGVGYTILEDESTLLLFEVGLAYFNENYRSATPSTDYLSARVPDRYEEQLSEATKFIHRAEVFPSLESSDDIYLQAVTELTTSLTGNMVASLSHILDYDNTPAPGRDRADNRVLLSVGWSF